MDLNDKFGFLFKQISLLNEKARNNELNKLDVTSQQAMIIIYLYKYRDRKLNQKDIENKFDVSKASISGLLNRLESKGFIYRSNESDDARCKNVYLTQAGINIRNSLFNYYERKENELVAGFSKEEEDTLRFLLKKVRDNIIGG